MSKRIKCVGDTFSRVEVVCGKPVAVFKMAWPYVWFDRVYVEETEFRTDYPNLMTRITDLERQGYETGEELKAKGALYDIVMNLTPEAVYQAALQALGWGTKEGQWPTP